MGGRHYYLSTDPNMVDLGPTCPANGGGSPPPSGTSGGGGVTVVVSTLSTTIVADGTPHLGFIVAKIFDSSTGLPPSQPQNWTATFHASTYNNLGGPMQFYGDGTAAAVFATVVPVTASIWVTVSQAYGFSSGSGNTQVVCVAPAQEDTISVTGPAGASSSATQPPFTISRAIPFRSPPRFTRWSR
jgi:hypothetical protein